MPILELGHTGFWVDDLEKMRDFYTRVVGLTITDEDPDVGIVFLSSRPGVEHHELVLARGRTAPAGTMLTHQVSWRVDSLETIIEYHRRFRAEGVDVQQEVTHGNAIGIGMAGVGIASTEESLISTRLMVFRMMLTSRPKDQFFT